jgi:hypothetical protein
MFILRQLNQAYRVQFHNVPLASRDRIQATEFVPRIILVEAQALQHSHRIARRHLKIVTCEDSEDIINQLLPTTRIKSLYHRFILLVAAVYLFGQYMLKANTVVNVKSRHVRLCRAFDTNLFYAPTTQHHRIVALRDTIPDEYMGYKGSLSRINGSSLNDLNPRHGHACYERRVASLRAGQHRRLVRSQ